MISWLGSGASPPTAPHPGGERPGKRAPPGLSYAKHSRVFARRMKPTAERFLLNCGAAFHKSTGIRSEHFKSRSILAVMRNPRLSFSRATGALLRSRVVPSSS
jgi:hypothetical protein